MAKGTNKINGITLHFFTDDENFHAIINNIDFEKGVKKIVFPEVVQLNGRNYVVTEISGNLVHIAIKRYISDKRKKDYGRSVNTGMYEFMWASVSGDEDYVYRWKDVKKIKLPKTLKRIGKYAFTGLPAKSIDIPNGVEVIDERAFENAKLEGTITIPSSVREIGDFAFSGSKKITLKIKNEEGAVKFGNHVVDNDDCVKYVGKGFLSKLFGK